MNPFNVASMVGNNAHEILNFAAKAIPGFEDKIKYALATGYTAEEVVKFLQGAFNNKKELKSYVDKTKNKPLGNQLAKMGTQGEQQEYARIKNKRLESYLDPDKILGTAVGAGIGALAGGPMGAIAGGVGAAASYDDILKKYEEHVNQGGQVPLTEYLKSLAKGAVKGAGAAGMAATAKQMLEAFQQAPQAEGEAPQEPSQPQEEALQPEQPQEAPQMEGMEVQEQVVTSPQDAEASYKAIVDRGMEGIVKQVAPQIPPQQVKSALVRLYGANRIKEIEKERGRPFEKVVEEYMQYQQQEPQAPVQEQQTQGIEEIQSIQEQEPQEMQRNISRQENPKGWSFQELLGEQQQEGKGLKGKARPFESSLKSGNLSAATFDEDTGNMRVVFRSREGRKGGDVYEYENLDLDTFNKMTGGAAKPITEGSNKFGVWFNTKNPSIGAAFDKYIKKNKEQFPYKKVEPKGWSLEESKIVEADRAHLASELFEPFAKKRLEGRQKARAQGLKDIVPALKNMDDDFLFDVVEYLESELKGKLKNEPKVQRLAKEFKKEFQGGK